MVFTDDTGDALIAAVALVNSADDPDTMTTVDDVNAFYDEHGYTGARPRSRADLEAVRALRAPLRRLLTSERDAAVPLVNAILAEHRALPQLLRHDALDWHLHAVELSAPFATRVAVETALAMVDVIRTDEVSRLGICSADDCEGVVLDLSRNRSRRFCSTACGNRAAVAAYRARQRG
ncbi:CGNR zinc finger domain-containing protein [Nocardioides sp.]|uniref:CGNR zinc finger domain-containing protein n=1 Tax=Nocardioides sp. TaxID=35761 RepID=UPI002D7E721A|nr:CGNR zinc finger domain-containing protein [Nocardioides sp.]HET8958817.1 CGNR zinc finger domain-containing protein [Nocardioides sp.]